MLMIKPKINSTEALAEMHTFILILTPLLHPAPLHFDLSLKNTIIQHPVYSVWMYSEMPSLHAGTKKHNQLQQAL